MTTDDLFNVGRKKKRAKKPPADPVVSAAIHHLAFQVYYGLYRQRFNEKPEIRPRDWKSLKELLIAHGPELVEERLRMLMAWDGAGSPMQWASPPGYTFSLLQSQWPTLTVLLHKAAHRTTGGSSSTCHHAPRCTTAAEHTRREIADRKGPTTMSGTSQTGFFHTILRLREQC